MFFLEHRDTWNVNNCEESTCPNDLPTSSARMFCVADYFIIAVHFLCFYRDLKQDWIEMVLHTDVQVWTLALSASFPSFPCLWCPWRMIPDFLCHWMYMLLLNTMTACVLYFIQPMHGVVEGQLYCMNGNKADEIRLSKHKFYLDV